MHVQWRLLKDLILGQGYSVVGVDVAKPVDDDQRIHDESFHFVQADVGTCTEAERIVKETVKRFGDKIHVLINNAGMIQIHCCLTRRQLRFAHLLINVT